MCFAPTSAPDLYANSPTTILLEEFCCDGQPLLLPHVGPGLLHFNDADERESYVAHCCRELQEHPDEAEFWLAHFAKVRTS